MRRFFLTSLASLIALLTPLSALAQDAASLVVKRDNQIQEVKAANVSEDAVTSETQILATRTVAPETDAKEDARKDQETSTAAKIEDTQTVKSSQASASIKNYTAIMRDLNARRKSVKTGAALNEKWLKDGEAAQLTEEEKTQLNKELDDFISAEEKRLDKLNVPRDRARAYFKRVERLHQAVDPEATGALGKLWQQVREKLGYDPDGAVFEEEKPVETRLPDKPARFSFPTEILKVQTLGDLTVEPMPGQDTRALLKTFGNKIKLVEPVSAEDVDPYLPTLTDVQADSADGQGNVGGQADYGEVIINAEIRDLAADLAYNPVKIFNFVRENITYEPYYGAKKGSVGCLQEKVCNDTDAASLTIALMRASGIPARYKKSAILIETARLKQLLGVDEVKTAFAALASNKVPVYVVTGGQPSNLDEANLEGEQYLAIAWTFPQIFYDYDARGGNITNFLQWSDTTLTAALQTELAKYPAKQWLSLDAIVKPYSRIKNEIVADTAGWDADTFFTAYLQYQGDLSPLDKYVKDLQTQTGKDITQTVYQSSRKGGASTFNILPPALPYFTGSAAGDGITINPETWSKLPDARRAKVTIELKREASNETVLTKIYFASAANNLPLDLTYAGFTATDEATIDSYGGIHATPAELAQIKPVLVGDAERTEGTTPLQIGESLILQFNYQRADGSTHTDQKFAVAGNSEGIYMVFSKVGGDSVLDDTSDPNYASKILLAGNSAMARTYIKKLQENADTIARSLDYTYQTDFTRAVITQNRVLNTVNGVPSTFDFKGLTIDAAAYIIDYSNRGNYKIHRKDFRLLWGLQASRYEGQLFTDLAGLESISTVIGLQHAYANPATYTVHTITSANESVIDTLALSDNTKTNMHADVQVGNTVYTPDKLVTKVNFTGTLYISLGKDWTGTYAIGEQTSNNGGWMVENFGAAEYCDEKYCYYTYKAVKNGKIFLHEDKDSYTTTLNCNISSEDFDATVADPEWSPTYGLPCFKPKTVTGEDYFLEFGDAKLSYKIATNATKFYRAGADGYSYWHESPKIKSQLDNYVANHGLNGTQSFRFSTILGTYMTNISNDKAVYYSPSEVGGVKGNVFLVSGAIFEKLDQDDQEAAKAVGYPTADQKTAAESIGGTGGVYQDFVGGQIYGKITWFLPKNVYKLHYVPNEIFEYYNAPENCRMVKVEKKDETHCGSGGIFGFPTSDPKQSGAVTAQEFEEATLKYDENTNLVTVVEQTKESRRYQNKEYVKKILVKVMKGEISDAEALAQTMDYIANRTNSAGDFVKDVTVIYYGNQRILSPQGFLESVYSNQNEFQWGNDKTSGDIFSDTGYKFDYNDSHFALDCENNRFNSNQAYHFMYGFNVGYFWGKAVADMATMSHDDTPSIFGTNGESWQDIWLGFRASDLGSGLANDTIKKGEAGEWVRSNLKDEVSSAPRSKSILMSECQQRSKFRKFEKGQLQDLVESDLFHLNYPEDTQRIKCGPTEISYQYYYRFGDMSPAAAVINIYTGSVFLIGDDYIKSKADITCNLINELVLSQ